MPNYVQVTTPGASAGSRYGTWAGQMGPSIGGEVSTPSGLAFNSGLTEWDRAPGYWADPNYLQSNDLALQQRVAKRTGQAIADPNSRYNAPATSGVPVPGSPGQTINPNDPNQRYRPVDIVKSPDIAAGQGSLMDSFKKAADESLAGFDDHLKTFKSALGDAFAKSRAANDPTQTIATLRSNQANYDAGLTQNQADYANLNADTAARERAIVAEARGLIPAYDTATNNARDLQLQKMVAQVNRYKAGTGAPTGLSSAELQLLNRGAADITVPMEQAKIAQRFNILDRYALPVEQDIANRESTRIGQYTPQVLAQQFQSGQATAQTIQALLEHTAQMDRQTAVQFMQDVGVPAEIQQKILTGQIQQLGALGQIEDQSRYRGLQDILGVQPTQSMYYSPATGAYPAPASRYPRAAGYSPDGGGTSTGTNPLPSSRAAAAPPAGAEGDWVWDANNQRWQNWRTGQTSPVGPYAGSYVTPPVAAGYTPGGSQSNSRYDTNTGFTYDRYNGQITNMPTDLVM